MVEGGHSRTRAKPLAQRVSDEPAYVLHRYPWKETSLILDVFTRSHGRVAVVAKGAKRPHSALRSTLVSFQALSVTYTGRAEVKTLARAEWLGGMAPLTGLPLMAAFYFNELLIKLLARDDSHPTVFDHYTHALLALQNGMPLEHCLRSFEVNLLTQMGVLPPLDALRHSHAPLASDRYYQITPEGLAPSGAHEEQAFAGAHLIGLHAQAWHEPGVLAVAKRVLRSLLAYHLGSAPLKTRQLLIDLHNL
jgi:DNA repair protein RecO (recombination protein O)